MLEIGAYPTPVELLSSLSTAACSLWIKRDDLSNPTYGGNKVRKLAHLLDDAKNCGATRVVTVGGVGSHHVLATGIFGRQAGLRVAVFEWLLQRDAHQPIRPHMSLKALNLHILRPFVSSGALCSAET